MTRETAEIDIFLSYKREDRATAKALAELLTARGYSVWWDIDLLPGDRFVDAVTEVIKRARVAIVLWSKQAVASDYVRGEAEVARQAGKLIAARLDDSELPSPFQEVKNFDLRRWRDSKDEASLKPLLVELAHRLGKPATPNRPLRETKAKKQEHLLSQAGSANRGAQFSGNGNQVTVSRLTTSTEDSDRPKFNLRKP